MNSLWFTLKGYVPVFFDGFLLTMLACALAVAGAVTLGAIIASIKTSGNPLLRSVGTIYTDIFRNVPFVVQLFFFFYGLPELGIYIGAFETGVIALSIAGGAFVADTIRSGILSIDQGILEAARVFGLSRLQIFAKIVMPIALRVSIRPMGAVLVNLILTSSILSTITVNELTGVAKIVASDTFKPFQIYAVLLILYAALTFSVSQLVNVIHNRLNRSMEEGAS